MEVDDQADLPLTAADDALETGEGAADHPDPAARDQFGAHDDAAVGATMAVDEDHQGAEVGGQALGVADLHDVADAIGAQHPVTGSGIGMGEDVTAQQRHGVDLGPLAGVVVDPVLQEQQARDAELAQFLGQPLLHPGLGIEDQPVILGQVIGKALGPGIDPGLEMGEDVGGGIRHGALSDPGAAGGLVKPAASAPWASGLASGLVIGG